MSAVPMDHMAVLRLEVENDYPGLANLMPNPSGDQGGWGWISPQAGVSLEGVDDSGQQVIAVSLSSTANVFFQSESMGCSPGDWVGASWEGKAVAGPGTLTGTEQHRVQVIFYDAAGANIGGAASLTGYLPYSPGTRRTLTPVQAPVLTESFRLQVGLYRNTAGNPPNANTVHKFRQFVAATGATAAAVTAIPWLPHPGWTNILGPTHNIRTGRTPLGLNTLAAEILDTTLDPATSDALRPGHKLRLQAKEAVTGTWRNVFPPSKLDHATVDYDLNAPAGKEARISVVALDAATTLGNAPCNFAYLSDPRYALEGAGVPWRVNGTQTGHATATALRYVLPDMVTVLDSIKLTRDKATRTYAWIDNDGVLAMATYTDATEFAAKGYPVYTDADFSGIGIGFDTTDVVNQLEVTDLDQFGASTDANYERLASRRKWGARKVTITTLAGALGTVSNPVFFDQHDEPVRRTRSMRIPIDTPSKITARLALTDLCQMRNVDYAGKSINEYVRTTSVSHTITPDGWLIDLEFAGLLDYPFVSDNS